MYPIIERLDKIETLVPYLWINLLSISFNNLDFAVFFPFILLVDSILILETICSVFLTLKFLLIILLAMASICVLLFNPSNEIACPVVIFLFLISFLIELGSFNSLREFAIRDLLFPTLLEISFWDKLYLLFNIYFLLFTSYFDF